MPDNAAYFRAAYAATATIFALYSLLLWFRVRRVRERLDALDAPQRTEG
jgi:hypothetical protein